MRLIERRIGLLFAGFLLCFLVIVGRAFWLQGVQGSRLASEAVYQQSETVTVPGLRGSLLDRRGSELATSGTRRRSTRRRTRSRTRHGPRRNWPRSSISRRARCSKA